LPRLGSRVRASSPGVTPFAYRPRDAPPDVRRATVMPGSNSRSASTVLPGARRYLLCFVFSKNASGRKRKKIPGNDLLSRPVARAVPSARTGLTTVFGMGTGVTPSLWSPGISLLAKGDEVCEVRPRTPLRMSFTLPARCAIRAAPRRGLDQCCRSRSTEKWDRKVKPSTD
jgi:hypothetical protein